MSYSHGQNSFMAGLSESVATTGVKASSRMHVGYQPVTIQAVALVVAVATTGSGVATIRKRPTPGSASGQEDVAVINIGARDSGQVVYADGLSHKVLPGEEVVMEVTTAAGAGSVTPTYFYGSASEGPGNNENMIDGAA